MSATENSLQLATRIEARILTIRGHKVMLDGDLAEIYGVSTKRLNEQVRRNRKRFPEDFIFQLTEDEWASLRSQIATSNEGRGGRRFRPYAFTEHGAVMLASVLSSDTAIRTSVEVVRAFVRLRGILAAHKDLARKLGDLEKKYDKQFAAVFEAIRQLMAPVGASARKAIGFQAMPAKSPPPAGPEKKARKR